MKISVAWSNCGSPTADTMFDNVYYARGGLLCLGHAEEIPSGGIRRIWFEAVSLEKGLDTARILKDWIQNCGVAKAEVMVEDSFLIDYLLGLEQRASRLEAAMKVAVNDLRATRTWLKDRRIGEIRRNLELAL
ncbi:hypothetical protein HY442_00875 [Candidatus Parcubacteria bacterium]|nr:hypothetical protein [Candidatus Parcubacteria bacterium]